jgi:hypothetical protein
MALLTVAKKQLQLSLRTALLMLLLLNKYFLKPS